MEGSPRRITGLLVALALAGFYLAAAPVAAAGERIHVAAVTVGVDYIDPGEERQIGSLTEFVWQLKGVESIEYLEGSPYLQGGMHYSLLDVVVHFSCDPAWPDCVPVGGAIHNRWSLEPDAFEGGWTGTGAGVVTGATPYGHLLYIGTGTARGWGELAGWHLQFTKWVDPVTGELLIDGWVTQNP